MSYTKIFYTVPMATKKLIRNSEGQKIDHLYKPDWKSKILFDGDWQDYIDTRNTKDTPLLGAIAKKDFIGIDIDNNPLMDQLYDIVKDDCRYVAISLPVQANKGGHLLFRYTDEAAEILRHFTKALKVVKIDIQMGNKLIFLATEANTTKKLITDRLTSLEDLGPVPAELLQQLILLGLPHQRVDNTSVTVEDLPETTYGYILGNTLTKDIVQELTPKRDYADIRDMDDIPRGSATDWLLKVRKKLQVDKSVSPEVFTKAIQYLTSLWSLPRGPVSQLDSDIARDIKSVDWRYDEDWNISGFIYPTTLGHAVKIFYDDTKVIFIQHNTYNNEVKTFTTATSLISSILSTHKSRKKFTSEQVLKKVEVVELVNTPEVAPLLTPVPGSYPQFNTFTPSRGTRILQGIEDAIDYKHPTTILSFMENLLVEKDNRDRFYKFITHKHKTYEHSSLYFVLAGVGGAGKGVLVNLILRYFSGDMRIQQADLGAITNNFNSWMVETDWLELEEVGEGYSARESSQLVGTLKKLTGNKYLSVEKKGLDRDTSKALRHFMTPIISTNMNTRLITDTISNDRRLVLFKCPNKLTTITNDTKAFIDRMTGELDSFAQYLRDLKPISHNDYLDNSNWKNKDYEDYIYDTTTVVDRLFEAIESKDLDRFVKELQEASIPHKAIDSMFSLGAPTYPAICLLYHTSSTLIFDTISLEQLAVDNPALSDTNIRLRFKAVKNRRNAYNHTPQVKINVLEFNKSYTPLVKVESIDPINSVDLN